MSIKSNKEKNAVQNMLYIVKQIKKTWNIQKYL
jgi:hypothetical protein